MRKDAIIKTAYHFPGLSVLVPDQIGQPCEIEPQVLPIPKGIPDDTPNFTPIRYIANLAFFCKDALEKNYYGEPIQEFDPPIEIRVNYNWADVCKTSCDIYQLKLAYWDLKKWVIISDPTHEYQILPPSTAEVAEVKIWSWLGDPTLAWGR